MPIATLNNLDMYYETHGNGEPLFLISGFGADHTIWLSVVELLSEHFQVIIFDNRGAGKSTVTPGPYTIEQLSQDVIDLCDHLNIESAYFCGNSMGGYITLTLLHQYRDRIKKAIISNSSLSIATPFRFYMEGKYQLHKTNAYFDAMAKIGCAFCFSYDYLSQPGMIDELIKLKKNHPNPFTLEGFDAQAQAVYQFNATTWANQITTPTLVIGSTDDLIFNETLIRDIANTIPNAEYYSFSRTGHIPSVEHPEEFSHVVKNYLQPT